MPDVISQGPNNTVSCGNCGAQLRFTRQEVRAGGLRPQSYDEHDSVITCPNCHRTVKVTHLVGTTSARRAAEQQRYEDDL